MTAHELLRRLGLDGSEGDPRLGWSLLLGILLLYVAAFSATYPRASTNEDETRYIHQARLLAHGETALYKSHPITGETYRYRASGYPIGNAALMAPLVVLFGPGAVFASACLWLVLGVVFCACWLRAARRPPIFALLVLGFPASLALGRVPLSDGPSMAAAALGLWLFWRGQDGSPRWWLASGFVAALSLLLRAPNALPFAAFFAGAVLRRERGAWALIAGGVLGLAVDGLANAWVFGDPLYLRGGYAFSPQTLGERLPLYLFGLLVLVPGGLAAGLAYRGRRRPELVATVALFFGFYLLQAYGMTASSTAKRLVIALRYFLPLLPILAFATAEVAPRLWAGGGRARGRPGPLAEAALAASLSVWIAGVATASVLVHWTLDRWTRAQAHIQEEILAVTGDDSVVVVNYWGVRKHLRLLERTHLPVRRSEVRAAELERLARERDDLFIVFLDRSDSEAWRQDARKNAAFLAALRPEPELLVDDRVTPTDRLRIWRVPRDLRVIGPGVGGTPSGADPEIPSVSAR